MGKEKKYEIDYEFGEDEGIIIIHLPKSDCHWLKNLSRDNFCRWMLGMNETLNYIMKEPGRLIDRDGA